MNVPAVVGVTSFEPESATAPLQSLLAWALLAWHPVALELDQVSVVGSPTVSAVGLAPILTMTGLGVGLFAEEDVVVGAEDAPPPPPLLPPQETSRRHAATAANCQKPRTRGWWNRTFMCGCIGASTHVVGSKADWKFRRDPGTAFEGAHMAARVDDDFGNVYSDV
jgi:hypothetical protein